MKLKKILRSTTSAKFMFTTAPGKDVMVMITLDEPDDGDASATCGPAKRIPGMRREVSTSTGKPSLRCPDGDRIDVIY